MNQPRPHHVRAVPRKIDFGTLTPGTSVERAFKLTLPTLDDTAILEPELTFRSAPGAVSVVSVEVDQGDAHIVLSLECALDDHGVIAGQVHIELADYYTTLEVRARVE